MLAGAGWGENGKPDWQQQRHGQRAMLLLVAGCVQWLLTLIETHCSWQQGKKESIERERERDAVHVLAAGQQLSPLGRSSSSSYWPT